MQVLSDNQQFEKLKETPVTEKYEFSSIFPSTASQISRTSRYIKKGSTLKKKQNSLFQGRKKNCIYKKILFIYK